MKAKRILHLINGMSVFGAERVAMELAQESAKKGLFVAIGLINGDDQMRIDVLDRLQGTNVDVARFSRGGMLSVCFRLFSYCRKQNITLIHSHGYKSDLLALIIKLFLPRIDLVATNHNYLLSTTRQSLYRWLDLRILAFYGGVVAVSGDVKHDMVAGGFSENRVEVIDNGITLCPGASADEKNHLLKTLGFSDKNTFIGIVASLTEEKAHRVLLSAFSQLTQLYPICRLIIIGDGPLREELEIYSDDLDISSFVHFMGYRKDSRQIMNILDIFVICSDREGLPLVLLEAMSIAVPAVATRVGAIPKVVEDSVSGLLVDPGCVEQLSQALKKMLEDKDLRNTLGKRGQQIVKEKYSSEKMTENYFKIYDGVNR